MLFLAQSDNDIALIIVFIAIGVLTIALLIGTTIFIIRKKKLSYQSLKDEYELIHTNFTVDCHSNLERIQVLGRNNDKYKMVASELEKKYNEIMKKRDNIISDKLSKLEKEINVSKYQKMDLLSAEDSSNYELSRKLASQKVKKDYKAINELQKDIEVNLESFKLAISNFSTNVSSYLMEDENYRNLLIQLKSKRVSINEFYERHLQELEPIKDSFEVIFDQVDEVFDQCSKELDNANYKAIDDMYGQLNAVLKATISTMEQLPLYVTSVFKVIPNKIQSLEKQYNKMNQLDFDIDHLNIKANIDEINKLHSLAKEKLSYLDTTDIKDMIDSIHEKITDNIIKLNEESDAKDKVIKQKFFLKSNVFTYEKEHGEAMKLLTMYKEIYVLNPDKIAPMIQLKSDVDRIGVLKVSLENFRDLKKKKPYTTILKEGMELKEEIAKVDKVMNDYREYLQSLKTDSESLFMGVKHLYEDLIVINHKIKMTNINPFIDSTKDNIESIRSNINDLNNKLLNPPIDTISLMNVYTKLLDTTNEYFKYIQKMLDDKIKAENAIVYANRFRSEFTDCDLLLKQAESAYLDGKFSLSLSHAADALRQWESVN